MKKVITYRDPVNDDFAGTNIKTKPLPEWFRYTHKPRLAGPCLLRLSGPCPADCLLLPENLVPAPV